MTYTDDDVQRLVEYATAVYEHLGASVLSSGIMPKYNGLERALKPFQPDPAAEMTCFVAKAIRSANMDSEDTGDKYWTILAESAIDAMEEFRDTKGTQEITRPQADQ